MLNTLKTKLAELIKKWKRDICKKTITELNVEEIQAVLMDRFNEQNEQEHEKRLRLVHEYLHEVGPDLFPELNDLVIVEGGAWNYTPLPSGKKLVIDFVLPSIPLYICVPGVESASWEEARLRGVTRENWDLCQADLKSIETSIPNLATAGLPTLPKLLIIKWQDTLNFFELEDRLRKLEVLE